MGLDCLVRALLASLFSTQEVFLCSCCQASKCTLSGWMAQVIPVAYMSGT